MDGLSAAGLADLAGVTEVEVARLVDLGVLVARDGAGPFRESDVQKVRLATAGQRAGLPMDGIAAGDRPPVLVRPAPEPGSTLTAPASTVLPTFSVGAPAARSAKPSVPPWRLLGGSLGRLASRPAGNGYWRLR